MEINFSRYSATDQLNNKCLVEEKIYRNNLKKFVNIIKNVTLKKIITLEINFLFIDIKNSLKKIKINLFNITFNRERINQ